MLKKLFAVALFLTVAAPVAWTDDKAEKPTKDIVEIAVSAKFDTLVAAVKAADLVDTLKGEGPFTVFAPTDEAFKKVSDKMGEEKFKALLEDKKTLKKILLAHVVVGKAVMAEDVIKLKGKKVNGFLITVKGDEVSLSNDLTKMAKVLKTDIKAKNGVIHVIDTVLMPDPKDEKKKKYTDDK